MVDKKVIYETGISMLPYGYTHAGKTALGVSSMWDFKKGKKVRDGKWVTIGREDNAALGVPEEMRIRLTSPDLSSLKFADDLLSLLKQIRRENLACRKEGLPLKVQSFFLDGMSEYNLLFEKAYDEMGIGKGSFDKWNALLEKQFATMQLLDPTELGGCHVIVSARVQERRKGTADRKTNQIIGEDSDNIFDDFYPAVRGSFRGHFPHYFDMVLYMERDVVAAKVKGVLKNNVPVHRIRLAPDAEYLVKNKWEHKWVEDDEAPDVMDNASFDDILDIIKRLDSKE